MLAKTLRHILEVSAEAGEATRPSIDLVGEVWSTLVGEPICHRTRPLRWDDQTLIVGVASEGWQNEMRRNRGRILRRLRGRFPWPIEALDFEVCQMPPPSDGGEEGSAESVEPTSVDDLDEALRSELERFDDRTRDAILRITGHLERQE